VSLNAHLISVPLCVPSKYVSVRNVCGVKCVWCVGSLCSHRSASSGVFALDQITGSLVWNFPVNGSIYNAPAVDAQGVIYLTFGVPAFGLCALLPNGTQKWTVPMTPAELSAPVLDASGLVIIGTNGLACVMAFNASNGQLVCRSARAVLIVPSVGLPTR
jgi:hypothetical protein